MLPDIHQEIGKILIFTSETAVALRLFGAYGNRKRSPEDLNHILWLSDVLHNFHFLGIALKNNNPSEMQKGCQKLLADIDQYVKGGESGQFASNPMATFEKSKVDLNNLIHPLRGILQKVSST